MKIFLHAVGEKMPEWVSTGYLEYAKRLSQPECRLELREVAPDKRGKNAAAGKIVEEEGERLLASIPRGAHVVALDVKGKPWSTEQLATQMEGWMQQGQDVSLMVGGPEGLSAACRREAAQTWSLSPLTFPHPLVRVIVAEQLYRAWSITRNHPYHRAG